MSNNNNARSRYEAQLHNLGPAAMVLIATGYAAYLDAIRRSVAGAQAEHEREGNTSTDQRDAVLAAAVATLLQKLPRAAQEAICQLALDILHVNAENAAVEKLATSEPSATTFSSKGGSA